MSLCLGLALAVHVVSLPLWVPPWSAPASRIRLALAARGYAPPRPRGPARASRRLDRSSCSSQLRTFNGLAAGTALLCLIAGLKLLETESRRDLYVIALIVYFLCLAALLRSESFWLLAYLLGVAGSPTATCSR